jgi:anti-repressor protein
MNQLAKVFDYQDKQVRTVTQGGEPWFVAKDVCAILEIENPSQALTRLDDDEKNTIILNEGIGNPERSIVSESGLYSLILGSRKLEAKAFKRWITHEVIPSIRKHGVYAKDELLDNPDLFITALQELKKEREQRKLLETKVEQDKPKVLFADAVTASNTTILVGELAKLLKQNNIDVGQNRLFAWLRENGYLIRRNGTDYNMPTQYSMELGLFSVKETSITHSDGHITVSKTAKVTGKGQEYFINKFLNQEKLLQAAEF